MGADDLKIEGVWKWINDESVVSPDIPHNHFSPSNSGGDENCLEFMANGLTWNDDSCHKPQRYICEKP